MKQDMETLHFLQTSHEQNPAGISPDVRARLKSLAKGQDATLKAFLLDRLSDAYAWKSTALTLLEQYPKQLAADEVSRVGKCLRDEDGGIRIKAAGVLAAAGTWPNADLAEALARETDERVRETLVVVALTLNGLPAHVAIPEGRRLNQAGEPLDSTVIEEAARTLLARQA